MRLNRIPLPTLLSTLASPPYNVTYVKTAMDAEIRGYVLKHSSPTALHAAIQEVLKGFFYMSPYLASKVPSSRHLGNSDQSEKTQLQTQHCEILGLLAEGKTAKEIAVHLHLISNTFEYHKYHIMLKLNIQTNARSSPIAVKHCIPPV